MSVSFVLDAKVNRSKCSDKSLTARMFIPLTEPERQAFMSQTSGSLIPGYTGHCPTLKFRFGRCYGANTKDIMQELREQGILNSARREHYRSDDPGKVVLTPIKQNRDQNRNPADSISNRSAKYILGYTGYIPGLNFRYGKSYSRAADDSMSEFGERQNELKRKMGSDHGHRSSSAPKMSTMRSEEEVSRTLKDYEQKKRFRERTISPECPPIAGYTGHIPRVKGNENSLSQRYYCVAKQGLSLLYQDRKRRNKIEDVENEIQSILSKTDHHYQ